MPFVGFHVHVQPMFINLINTGYQIVLHHLNKGMPMLKIVYITKYLNIYNYWIIIYLLDNNMPHVELENTYALIISGMSINKADIEFWIFIQNITFQKFKNWIFICLMILLQLLLKKGWYLHSWRLCGNTQMVAQIIIFVHIPFIY